MSIPKAPELTAEQIEKEILEVLKREGALHYKGLWGFVLAVHFRNSPENDMKFQQAVQSLAKRGQVVFENGWASLKARA